ncbi:MAG: hypothetical protein RRY69_07395 [Oscillospiraceae bacterium]
MKKTVSILLALLLVASLLPAAAFAATGRVQLGTGGTISSTPMLNLSDANNRALKGTIEFKNASAEEIKNVTIEMATSIDIAVFPFDVSQLSYRKDYASIAAGAPVSFDVNLVTRSDAAQNYYEIPFTVSYDDPTAGALAGARITETLKLPVRIIKSGSGAGPVAGSVPKVIISNFGTSPAAVVAGEQFTLTVTFKNTSSSVSLTNLKAALTSEGGTFSPVSGSSTLFVESIAPGATQTKSILLIAKADVAPGSYTVTFGMNYDAVTAKDPVTDTEVLSLPVKQVPKAQFAKIQVTNAELYVGQDFNLMSSVFNTGKAKLYNVTVTLKDANGKIKDGEQYLGNVDPGATGNIDLFLTPVAEGEASIKMIVTYENEKGEKFTHEDTYVGMVVDKKMTMDPGINDPNMPQVEEKGGGMGFVAWLLIVLGAVGVAFAVLIIVKKNKVKKQEELDRQEALAIDKDGFAD